MNDSDLFALLDLDNPDLGAAKTAFENGDVTGAKAELARHIRERKSPKWLFDWRDRPDPSKKPEEFPKALAFEKHTFTFGFHGAGDFTSQFGESIDWGANPTTGESKTHLWNESLNRHFHFNALSEAYWQTGDERFVEAIARDWVDWVASNPRPNDSGNKVEWPYGCYAWQTLTTAIRLEASWPNTLYRCMDSDALTDEVIVAMMGSTHEQAQHLIAWPTAHNWLTEECMGAYTAGMLFPEFKAAAEWRRIAIERLYGQLTNEVYPDGAEYELAGGYGFWVVRNFVNLLERARLNGFESELPDDLVQRMEKMFDYALNVAMPDGHAPGLNDSGNVDVTGLLTMGFELFPGRTDFQYVATRRAAGTVPEKISIGQPWSGHYVMRSGWEEDALFMLVDSGPYGSAHQHEDKLHFVLYAYGRQLILDPGNFSYDASRQRHYVLTTPGHNTVMVDGMGQRRRGNQATYFWERPWEGDEPSENDTLWLSDDRFDILRGTYRDGYGHRNDDRSARVVGRLEMDDYEIHDAVTHTRHVFYLKPDYWVITDTMVASDDGEHTYEALFHLDAEEAQIDETLKSVTSQNSDEPNVRILPMADDELEVKIVKGQDEPFQGWGNDPWRPVPTAIYSYSGKKIAWTAYAVCPTPAGETAVVTSVDRIPCSEDDALGLSILRNDGRKDVILISQTVGTVTRFEEYEMDGEIAVLRMEVSGEVDSAEVVQGSRLSANGESILP
jgi:hypothetical protein